MCGRHSGLEDLDEATDDDLRRDANSISEEARGTGEGAGDKVGKGWLFRKGGRGGGPIEPLRRGGGLWRGVSRRLGLGDAEKL